MNMTPTKSIEQIASAAEAMLFAEGGPMLRKKLATALECKEAELQEALAALSARLTGGISLVQTDSEVSLAISKESSGVVLAAQKKELSRDIGEAGLEVLSIILYCGPSTRARIDYIRGVNTASTLRALLSRGLIEREGNPADAREYLYKPSVELLAHLGVSRREELPDYATISAELARFEQEQKNDNGNTEPTTE